MFNLIKMNFYRLFHNKAFYIMIGVAAGLGMILISSLHFAMNYEESYVPSDEQTEGFNVYIDEQPEGYGVEDVYGDVIIVLDEMMKEIYQSGFLMIIVAVFASVMTWGEYKNGFVKNIAGQMSCRWYLAAAKLPVLLFQAAVILAVTVLFTALTILFFYHEIKLIDPVDFIRSIGYQLLLLWGFGAFISMLTVFFKSTAGGIIPGILMASGLPAMICRYLDKILIMFLHFPKDFEIEVYTVEKNLTELMLSPAEGTVITRGITVGIAYLVISAVLSFTMVQKRDVE